MLTDILKFRNNIAQENGIELTPEQAEKVMIHYQELREALKEAVTVCPNFCSLLCNQTTEEKLECIKKIEKEKGDKVTLKEYNEMMNWLKLACELEGYV